MSLVLSLFPGADLLGLAFELEGFTIVAGPDIQFGRDVRTFHVPAGRFDGVIGGPPCQAFSRLRFLVEHNGYEVAANLIPEFERLVSEAAPAWFVMENVPDAPLPRVDGYEVHAHLVRDVWVGGATSRLRRFSFGTRDGRRFPIEAQYLALHRTDPEFAVLASGGGRDRPVAIGGSGKPKRNGGRIRKARDLGYKTADYLANACRHQGLPPDFLEGGPFTVAGKIKLIGNGVPLPMGRAVARAVREAMASEVAA